MLQVEIFEVVFVAIMPNENYDLRYVNVELVHFLHTVMLVLIKIRTVEVIVKEVPI